MPLINDTIKNSIKLQKPFISDGTLMIKVTKDSFHRIEKIECTYKTHSKTFYVKDFNVLKAWQDLEAWLLPL